MRIWVNTERGLDVNFVPETDEERVMLDKVLGYEPWKTKPIGNKCWKKIGHGAEQVAGLGGHEQQRWISIDLKSVLRIISSEPKKEVVIKEKNASKQCSHGQCVGHSFDHDIQGRKFEQKTSWFGAKTYLLDKCCGKPMQRVMWWTEIICGICGAKEPEDRINKYKGAYCLCCKKLIDMEPLVDF